MHAYFNMLQLILSDGCIFQYSTNASVHISLQGFSLETERVMDAYFNMLQLILSDGCIFQYATVDITCNVTSFPYFSKSMLFVTYFSKSRLFVNYNSI